MASVRLFVSDTEKAKTFYVDMLGFTLVEQWGTAFAIVEHEGLELWLSGPTTSAAQPLPDGSQPEPGGWNRIVIGVVNIEAKLQALTSQGVVVRSEPISGPGGQQALIEDGVGNFVEIFQER